jgi:hypothetical protein
VSQYALAKANDEDSVGRTRLILPISGSSSGVEHNLAKVGVEGSNPFSRSISRGRIMAIMSDFHSEDEGSIPFPCSMAR